MFSERGHPAAGGLPASRIAELGVASPMTPGGAHNAALCAPPSERLALGGGAAIDAKCRPLLAVLAMQSSD